MVRVNVRIRPAEHGDVDGLVALTRCADPSSERAAQQLAVRFDEILDDDDRTLLVACADQSSDLLGLLVARQEEVGAIDVTPALHVSDLLVTPKHRRRGVGRSLLSAAVRLADELGVERVLATVSASSREANRYLARLGFAPVDIQRVASTGVLRRALVMTDEPDPTAVLRRARLMRAQRSGLTPRALGRGA